MSNKNKSKLPTQPTRLVEPIPVMNTPMEVSDNKETVIPPAPVLEEVAVPTPTQTKKISYEYKIVTVTNNLELFQIAVADHLNNGWELSGGVSCTMYTDSYSALTIWSQAVYKKITN
jgi:hypothetical protein